MSPAPTRGAGQRVPGGPTAPGPAAGGETVFPYKDASGQLLYQVVRRTGKRFVQRCPDDGSWRYDLTDVERVPYRLPELLAAAEAGQPAFVVEGEKDADRLSSLGLVATTNSQGTGFTWPDDWPARYFRGLCAVYVLADNDEPGQKAAKARSALLAGTVPDVRLVEQLPGVGPGEDVSDFLDAGADLDDLWQAAEAGVQVKPADVEATPGEAEQPAKAGPELLGFAQDAALFRTPDDVAWAKIPCNAHVEYHPVNSRRFQGWLRQRYFAKTGRSVPAAALTDAVATLDARAMYGDDERSVAVRVAAHGDAVIIDLGGPTWEAVEVSRDGWRVVAESPAPFRRRPGLAALPCPESGGDVARLGTFLNVDDDDWPLVLAFLVGSLRPTGPYPVLVVHGEQGSAKTTLTRVLRALVDPSMSPTRSAPSDARDLAIAANNAWLLCYDNLSRLTPWFSDALCRLSTGGGLATRSLYSNDEEAIFEASRPVIVNGIEEQAQRPDLLDRSIIVHCPVIPDERRREETELWAEFGALAPSLFGAILDAMAEGLRRFPDTRLERKPRMADFARFSVACEPALGLAPGEFLGAYTRNQAAAHVLALDAAPIWEPLRDLVSRGPWEGTYRDLLAALTERLGDTRAPNGWPASARGLSGQLTRLSPNLRANGICVESHGRQAGHGGAVVSVRRNLEVPGEPSRPSRPSQLPFDQEERA